MTYLEEDNEQWVLQRNIKKAKNVKEMRFSCCFVNQENEENILPCFSKLDFPKFIYSKRSFNNNTLHLLYCSVPPKKFVFKQAGE